MPTIKTVIKLADAGERAVRHRIILLDKRLCEFEEPLKKIRSLFLSRQTGYVFQNFETQGKTFQRPWKKLSEATIRKKQRLARKGEIPASSVRQILVRTGKMKDNFRGDISKKEYGLVGKKHQLVIHNPTPYFRAHQSASPSVRTVPTMRKDQYKTAVLPRRVMLLITRAIREHIRMIGQIHVKDKARRAVAGAESPMGKFPS